ncbi:Hypothetical protein CINCED_3A010286 [Cinara cedri]|uniref:MRH domain-containing protein n=1 Tax=Cinara cedri TaxID=506608 RepID=A0A5E4NCP6_9HEMI|nr:Hypothetical protein CINCED_3A010286 [Cinara cedri]
MPPATTCEILVGALAVVVAAVCCPTYAVPVNSCGLQTDTAAKRHDLTALDRLSGQLLTTESNGNIYYVSICHHVPQMSYYDPRKLVGAVKYSKEGYSINLGRIDQSNVFINDNNIVLTYIGDDGNRDPRDPCKGLRWSTYLTFICDTFLKIDILTLVDEDPNQPETCTIKFEIRTSKTCNRQPISVQNINHINQIGGETEKTKLNQIPFGNELTKNYKQFSNNNNTSNIQIEENNLNQNNLQAISSLNKPLILLNSKPVYENKFTRNESIQKSSNQNGLVHMLPNDRKNHLNFELDNKYLNQNSEDTLFNNANGHFSKGNTFTNFENKNTNLNQYDSKSNSFNNKHNTIGQNQTVLNYYKNKENNLNKTNSPNENPEDKPSSDQIESSDKNKNNESINPNSNQKNSEKAISNNENNNSQNKNSEGKPSSDQIENSDKNTNNESINPNSNQTISEKAISNNEKNNSQYKNSESKPSSNQIENSDKNNENINPNSNQTISEKVISNNEKNNLNNTNSPNENTEGIPFSDSTENLNNSSIKTNSNINQNSNHTVSEGIISNNKTNSGNNNKLPDEENKENNSNQTNAQNINSEVTTTENYNENSSKKNVTDIVYNKSNNSLQNNTQNDDSKNASKSDSEDTSTLSNLSTNDTNKIDSSNEKNYNSSSDSTIFIVTTESSKNYDSSTTSDDQTNLTTEKIVNGSISNSNTSDLNNTYLNKINTQSDQNTKSPIKTTILSNNNNNDNLTATDSASQSEDNSNSGTIFSKLFPNGIQLSAATIFGGLGSLSAISVLVGAAINRYYYKRTGTDQIPFKGTFQSIYMYIKVFLSKICCCCSGNLGTLDFTDEKTPLLQPKMFSAPIVPDETLKQKSKISSDDSKSRKSEDFDSDNSNGEKKTKTYGSMEYKSDSYPDNQATLYNDKEKLFKTEHNLQGKSLKKIIGEKTSALFNVKLIENIFEKVEKKFEKTDKENTKENVDIPPTGLISQLLKKGKSIITNENDIAHNEVIKAETNDTSKSHIIQIDKSEKQSSEVEQNKDIIIKDNVDVKSITNFDSAKPLDNTETTYSHEDNLKELIGNTLETSETELSNQNKIKKSPNDVTKDEIAIDTTINKSQQNDVTSVPEIKTMDKDISSELSDLNDLIADLQAFSDKIENNSPKSTDSTVSEIGIIKQNNENDILNKSENGNMASSSEIANKTKVAKLQFSAADNQEQQIKNKNVQVEFTNESNVSEKKIIDDDDDSTEIIEEVIYIDGAEGEENEEEIIEETIETTVVETPDANSETLPFSDSHKSPTTTTVRKTTTRKISSTSAPDEITTVEETIVSGYTPEQEKNKFGFQIGIGKSGVNMSVGDKSIGINTSDVNFGKHEDQGDMNKTQDLSLKLNKPGSKYNKKKQKTSTNIEGEEPNVDVFDERGIISSEKSKKSKTLPNLKIFKRSISQPSHPDIEEVKEESLLDVASKKKGRSTSSLFKLGKSKSKSPEKTDVKTNVNASLSGQEQRTSSVSTIDNRVLETGGDEVVAERKISIKTEGGKKSAPKKEKR